MPEVDQRQGPRSARTTVFAEERRHDSQLTQRHSNITRASLRKVNRLHAPQCVTTCGTPVLGVQHITRSLGTHKGGSTLVTLPRIVTPYRDGVDGIRARVTYQKLVTW